MKINKKSFLFGVFSFFLGLSLSFITKLFSDASHIWALWLFSVGLIVMGIGTIFYSVVRKR